MFNLNDGDGNNSQTVFEYLGHELIIRCANDLICARPLYVQCCSLPTSSSTRAIQRFYQGIDQACQQLDCTLLKTTAISVSSSFNSLCTGVCNREFLVLNNHDNNNSVINENDFLIGLRCSSGTINSQGYVQLKDLFQKKNIHLNDILPFRNNDGEEESFFSLLLQKTSILTPALAALINELVLNRTIKVIKYLKGKASTSTMGYLICYLDVGLARMIESLLGSSTGTLTAELNGQQWPMMPPIFTWIYQHVNKIMNFRSVEMIDCLIYFQSGFSQDEMFEYFNCGIDYLLVIDHTKSSAEDILQQLTQIHSASFLLGTLTSISKYVEKMFIDCIYLS